MPTKRHSRKKNAALTADRQSHWPSATAGTRWIVLAFVGLALVTATLYSPVRQYAFVNYDDGDYVLNNEHVHHGLTPESVSWAFSSTSETGNWHPLTWMSHELDCELFGLDAAGHHLMSLALHMLNVLLLAWILMTVTGAPVRSVIVAGLFAVHPLNVESVAWISERKNVLSTFFFLLTLCAYGRYVIRPGVSRYLAIVVTFALALAAKPMAVTLPFVLLLADYWPLRRAQGLSERGDLPQLPWMRCVREKVPLLAMSAAGALITVIAQHNGGAVKTLDAYSLGVRLRNAAYAYAEYLAKTSVPTHLAAFYPHPGTSLAWWKIGLCVVFLVAVTWGAWKQRQVAPYLIVGWLWFLGTLVPVIGVVQVGAQAMADRYAYVPLIGIFAGIVWGVGDLCGNYRVKPGWPVAAAGVALATLSAITWTQVGYWRDSTALWTHALAVTADNAVAENQLGMAWLALNREEEAIPRFQQAIALGGHDPTGYLNVGAYLNEHGRYQEAVPILEKALRMEKDRENAVLGNLNLGFVYTSMGDYENARQHFRAAVQLDRNRVEGSILGLEEFAAAHPSAKDYLKLGLMLEEDGRNDEAAAALRHGFELQGRPATKAGGAIE